MSKAIKPVLKSRKSKKKIKNQMAVGGYSAEER